MEIGPGDFDDPQVLALLRAHFEDMHAKSPPGTCYVLDLSELRTPDISFFAAWDGGALVGMGALKALDAVTAELKSMRTHADHLRKGVAQAMLDHLLGVARERGYARVSLETGTGPDFAPALALYLRNGFADGEAFGGYAPSPHNQFLHLEL